LVTGCRLPATGIGKKQDKRQKTKVEVLHQTDPLLGGVRGGLKIE